MPTPEQNIAFINSMREHYKNIKLSIIDKKSEDDRKVLNQLKKIGFKLEDFNTPDDNDNDNTINPDIIQDDNIGELEFNFDTTENNNQDQLDFDDHGFLYD